MGLLTVYPNHVAFIHLLQTYHPLDISQTPFGTMRENKLSVNSKKFKVKH
jgi:hypothetical protein